MAAMGEESPWPAAAAASSTLRAGSAAEADAGTATPTPLSAVAEAFEGLARTLAEGGDLRLRPLTEACGLVSVLFGYLGLAFKFAEIEYVAKVNDLVDASKTYDTLDEILDDDLENDTVKKQGSHSRNLRRVRLGLDLIKALFERFVSDDEGSLYDAASMAYDEVCAPFHSWVIRTAVSAGLYTLPSREQLISNLSENEYSVQKEMRRYVKACGPIIQHIDHLFLSRNISLDW